MTENTTTQPVNEPLFNIPPVAGTLFAVLLIVHAIRLLGGPAVDAALVDMLAFVPANATADPAANAYRLMAHALLHFGWLHMAVNGGGILAFCSGVENLFGRRVALIIVWGGVVAGAATHWVLFPYSAAVMGGVSAGVCALFGALTPFLARNARSRRRLIAMFVAITVIVGLMGMPDNPDASIAWQAHLGGFGFGVAAGFYLRRRFRITRDDIA